MDKIDWTNLLEKIQKLNKDACLEIEPDLQQERYARQQRLEISGINQYLKTNDRRNIVIHKLNQIPCLDGLKKWMQSNNLFCISVGTVGRGKTISAGYLLAELSPGKYYKSRDIERIFRADFGEMVKLQNNVLNTKILVIDDLGTEKDAVLFTGMLYEIIDARQASKKTLLISNLSKTQLEKRYIDPRIWSRLSGTTSWIQDRGIDLRTV